MITLLNRRIAEFLPVSRLADSLPGILDLLAQFLVSLDLRLSEFFTVGTIRVVAVHHTVVGPFCFSLRGIHGNLEKQICLIKFLLAV